MKKIVEDLNWRYATKQFDASKKLTNEQLEIIKESLRLTPSAYGIQPLKFIFVSSPALREEIKEIAFNQGWIDAAQVEKIAAPLIKSGYGRYLMNLLA